MGMQQSEQKVCRSKAIVSTQEASMDLYKH